MSAEQIGIAAALGLAVVMSLAGHAWAFLTVQERARVLWWMFVTPWVPAWIVSTDWYAEAFARYVGRFLLPIEPDVLTEVPGCMR